MFLAEQCGLRAITCIKPNENGSVNHHFRVSCSNTQFGSQDWKEGQYHDERKDRWKKSVGTFLKGRNKGKGEDEEVVEEETKILWLPQQTWQRPMCVLWWLCECGVFVQHAKSGITKLKELLYMRHANFRRLYDEKHNYRPCVWFPPNDEHWPTSTSAKVKWAPILFKNSDKYETQNVYFIIFCVVCSKWFLFQYCTMSPPLHVPKSP